MTQSSLIDDALGGLVPDPSKGFLFSIFFVGQQIFLFRAGAGSTSFASTLNILPSSFFCSLRKDAQLALSPQVFPYVPYLDSCVSPQLFWFRMNNNKLIGTRRVSPFPYHGVNCPLSQHCEQN